MQYMTLYEVSMALKVSESSIRRSIKKLFPNSTKQGKKIYLTEKAVTLIKIDLTRHHNFKYSHINKSDLNNMKQFLNYTDY